MSGIKFRKELNVRLREGRILDLFLIDSLHHGAAGTEHGHNKCQNDKSRHPEIVSGDDPKISPLNGGIPDCCIEEAPSEPHARKA